MALRSVNGEVEVTAQNDVTTNAAVQAGTNVTLLSKNAAVSVNDTVTAENGDVTVNAVTGISAAKALNAGTNVTPARMAM